MNKIFKVKKNALGQSVACSELATSRSKSLVVVTALAIMGMSGMGIANDISKNPISFYIPGPNDTLVKKNSNIDEFATNTSIAIVATAEEIIRLKKDVDTVANIASDIIFNQANIAATAVYVNGLTDIVNNNVMDIEGLQAQITANQADTAKNFADTDAKVNANAEALKTKVEQRDFYHVQDNVNNNNTEIAKLQANKADVKYVEETIAETVGYVNSVAEATDKNAMDIAENKADIANNKAEVAKIEGLQAQITANQADTAKNFADTDAKVNANADALKTKVEQRDFYYIQDNVNNNNTEIAKLQANKADVEYVEETIAETVGYVNSVAEATDKNAMDIVENKAGVASNKANIAKNKTATETNKTKIDGNAAKIRSNTDALVNKVDVTNFDTLKGQVTTLATQVSDITPTKARVSALENRTTVLETRVNKLDKNLSAGIAGTAALSMMPTAGEKGAHYITAGAGHYNGQQAIAIGLTGNSNSGKFNYKVGASATTSGSPVVGAGVGYRWK
ncbi:MULTISPECIES: YadA-like family protein [unclassified Mannheimia]|uniref:YadA-like family protein n=1 Tax=unclassified Mannheimia TaxID=2645054 RepID=UPI00359DD08C